MNVVAILPDHVWTENKDISIDCNDDRNSSIGGHDEVIVENLQTANFSTTIGITDKNKLYYMETNMEEFAEK